MPPVCNPQHFLPLMNYSHPWPGGRSIMQKAEALAGPSFQLTGSAPSSGEVLSQASGPGPLKSSVLRAPGCKHAQKGELWTISAPPLPEGTHLVHCTKEPYIPGLTLSVGIPALGQECKIHNSISRPSLCSSSQAQSLGMETQENQGVHFGCE